MSRSEGRRSSAHPFIKNKKDYIQIHLSFLLYSITRHPMLGSLGFLSSGRLEFGSANSRNQFLKKIYNLLQNLSMVISGEQPIFKITFHVQHIEKVSSDCRYPFVSFMFCRIRQSGKPVELCEGCNYFPPSLSFLFLFLQAMGPKNIGC